MKFFKKLIIKIKYSILSIFEWFQLYNPKESFQKYTSDEYAWTFLKKYKPAPMFFKGLFSGIARKISWDEKEEKTVNTVVQFWRENDVETTIQYPSINVETIKKRSI